MALVRLTRDPPPPPVISGPDVYSPFTKDSEYQGGPGSGHAVRHMQCGQDFDGYWKDDEPEGPGQVTTTAGSSYHGQWQVGKWHGEGTYKWPSGSSYSGQWVEGKKEGKGKQILYSGNSYDGEWKADKRHGWGLFTVAKPTTAGVVVYEGEWVHDLFTGKGTAKGVDGALEINRYQDGKRIGEGVRWLDPNRVKPGESTGPFRLTDGKEGEEIDPAEAEAIAQAIGVPVPQFPFHE